MYNGNDKMSAKGMCSPRPDYPIWMDISKEGEIWTRDLDDPSNGAICRLTARSNMVLQKFCRATSESAYAP